MPVISKEMSIMESLQLAYKVIMAVLPHLIKLIKLITTEYRPTYIIVATLAQVYDTHFHLASRALFSQVKKVRSSLPIRDGSSKNNSKKMDKLAHLVLRTVLPVSNKFTRSRQDLLVVLESNLKSSKYPVVKLFKPTECLSHLTLLNFKSKLSKEHKMRNKNLRSSKNLRQR